MNEKRVLGTVQRIERKDDGEASWIEITVSFHIPVIYDPPEVNPEPPRVREALMALHLGSIEVEQK